MNHRPTILAADLFCGCGGTSLGLVDAAELAGYKTELWAVNHWEIAVATHAANFPGANHVCASLDSLDPRKVVPGGRLDLLVASPECTHHSRARGGKPIDDQRRASAWCVVRWAEALRPKSILVENVSEFQEWGPVDDAGKPLPAMAGRTYRAFLTALRSLGYQVSAHVVCCANYGDATTRARLFIMATLGRRPRWPDPTHAEHPERSLVPRAPWRPAREIIDWALPAESIFARKRPLRPNTLRRIEAGLRKFCGLHYLAQPFVIGQQSGAAPRGLDMPLPTIAAAGAISLVQPFLVEYHGGPRADQRVRSLGEPLPTQDCSNRFGVCEPFILPNEGLFRGNAPRSVGDPLPTITASRGCGHLVQPYLVKFNGTGGAQSVDEPLDTVTTKDRHGLVLPLADGEQVLLDIRFRMLQPQELAAAMSFPADYQFSGNREDRVRQIGNAVPVATARALCGALIA